MERIRLGVLHASIEVREIYRSLLDRSEGHISSLGAMELGLVAEEISSRRHRHRRRGPARPSVAIYWACLDLLPCIYVLENI